MGWTTGVRILAGEMKGYLHFVTESEPVLGPTLPPIQWVPGLKWPGRRAIPPLPPLCLVKHRGSSSVLDILVRKRDKGVGQ
jgi:hypothetical protein